MSKKPRKIGQAEIDALEDFCSEAVGAKEAAHKATSVAKAAERDYQQKLKKLQIKIATGVYATGDQVLDWNILLHDSVQKDERYALMAQFDKVLRSRGGELVAEVDGLGVPRHVGLLPEPFAGLAIQIGGAYGADQIRFGGDATVKLILPLQKEACRLVGGCNLPVQFEAIANSLGIGRNLIFEEEIQEWLQNHPDQRALEIWLDSLELGRPLTLSAQLLELLIQEREKLVVELHQRIASLQRALGVLTARQANPKDWDKWQCTVDGETVVVSFNDEVGSIRRNRNDLLHFVGLAKRLGMENSPANSTYLKAADLLESTAQYE